VNDKNGIRSSNYKNVRSIRNRITVILFTSLLFLAVSCTTGSCFEETNADLKASFYLSSSDKPTAPDSLTLYGLGKDSLRYKKAPRVQPAFIPLDASAENCGFVIRINGVNDTISFSYSTFVHFISKECGYTYFHNLESVNTTKNIIDTIHIKLKSITTLNEPNIYIYY